MPSPARLLLVAPPWLDIYGDFRAAAKIGCVSPPLGLAYLAGAILEAGGECEIIDMELKQPYVETLLGRIAEYQPHIVGISATTPVYHNARLVAREVKRRFPDIPIIIGGVHVTILGAQVLEECADFDYGVAGEAECVIQDIVRAVGAGGSLAELPGVIHRDGERVIANPRYPLPDDLDEISPPARGKLDVQSYRHHLPGQGLVPYASLFTSRGCPFRCTFCSQHTMHGRRMRWHSVDRVIEELKVVTGEFGVRHVIMMDETLTLKKDRTVQICEAIKDAGLDFTWEGWTHASTVDEKLLRVMKSAGMVRISFGIESGDPDILKSINKGVTLDQIRRAYRAAREVGLETRGSAILGHPFETRETAWRTIRFVRDLDDCQQVFLNVACPYPGTELYDAAVSGKGGLKLLTQDYSKYQRYGMPVVSVNDLGPHDLKRLQSVGLLLFYLTPSRIRYNLVQRAGLRSGFVNGLSFMRGIASSLGHAGLAAVRASNAPDVEPQEGIHVQDSVAASDWDSFWKLRQVSPTGRLISWFRKRYVTTAMTNYILENTERGTLVEAGSGSGEVTLLAAKQRGDHVVLVDKSPEAVEQARSRALELGVKAKLVQCDIEQLSTQVERQPQSTVFNIGVIEHFEDPRGILEEMAAASEREALAVVPEDSPFWRIYIGLARAAGMVPPDFLVKLYSASELEQLVREAGLEVRWTRRARVAGVIPYVGVGFAANGKDQSL